MKNLNFIHETLLFLIIISFGFFGSLSHLFTFLLLLLYSFFFSKKCLSSGVKEKSLALFLILVAPFIVFLLRSLITTDFTEVFQAISPMLPVPIIGFLILFASKSSFEVSEVMLSKYSQITIIFIFCLCLLVLNLPEKFIPQIIKLDSRINLLTGNAIPFSLVVFCISFLCITDWANFTTFQKNKALVIFLLGVFIATVLTETRGTMGVFILTIPIILWHIKLPNTLNIIASTLATITVMIGIMAQFKGWIHVDLIERLSNALLAFTSNPAVDESIALKLDMWEASIKTIIESPYIGYGIAERFTSLQSNLPSHFIGNFSHPHNDIFAGALIAGVISGILSLLALLAPFWAWFVTNGRTKAGLFLGVTFSISFLATASLNTIFFNDVTSAWLAFSTFVVYQISRRYVSK